MMYVYVDVLLATNLIINSIILVLTAKIIGLNYKRTNLFLAAILGSIYVLGGFVSGLTFWYSPVGKLLLSIVIVYIAFGKKKFRIMFLTICTFYIVSFIIGGAILGWIFFWQSNDAIPVFYKPPDFQWPSITWCQVAVGGSVGVVMILLVLKYIRKRIINNQHLYDICIELDGRSVTTSVLLDTGNQLYTLTGLPVILVNLDTLRPILGEKTEDLLRRFDLSVSKQEELYDIDGWLTRIQLIPYRTVKGSDILVGFRPDNLKIITGRKEISLNNICIGVYKGQLSSSGSYSGLLHPACLTELIKEEKDICALVGQ